MNYAFGYRRVSTSDQKDSDLGLTAQQEAIEAYYQQSMKPKGFGWGGLYTDAVVSGSKDFVNREAGGELNLRLCRGDMVLFHKIDRGFRSISDMLSALKAFEQRGVGAFFIAENLSTNDGPMGTLLLHILGAFAEFERTMIATRTREAMAVIRAKGQPLNRHDLVGFKWVGPKGKKRVVRDDHDRSVMGNIVKWRRCGISWNEIVDHIAKHDVLTSRGGDWNRSRVRRAYVAELYLQAIEAAGRKVEESPAELLAYRNFCSEHIGRRGPEGTGPEQLCHKANSR